MIAETDAAYIAGLFDGEGSIYYAKRGKRRKRNIMAKGYRLSNRNVLSMEVTMTDESVLTLVT